MILDNGVFQEDYRTSFTHIGVQNVLTNKSFLLLMENLAGLHSSYCGFSFKDLAGEHLTWIILGWKLKVLRRPKDEETVTIKTWARYFNKVFVLRDFKMYDDDGNLCAIATSKWCLINQDIGKIAPMPSNIAEIYHGLNAESVFDIDDLPRIQVPESAPIAKENYRIRKFDLDLNKHVHNLNYLNFAYEVLPEDVFYGPEKNNVEITFRKELKYNQVIHSFLYKEGDTYTIVIKDETEKTVHAIVKLY
jgi:medium-chain acyl-[acyl-carrier-protein] hydrolase